MTQIPKAKVLVPADELQYVADDFGTEIARVVAEEDPATWPWWLSTLAKELKHDLAQGSAAFRLGDAVSLDEDGNIVSELGNVGLGRPENN